MELSIRLRSSLTVVAAMFVVSACTTGYPLKLHSNPERATVCWHAIDGWACHETPYTVYFPDKTAPISTCFETTPFQFTWQSGARSTSAIKVCPGNTYYVANRPNLPNLGFDVGYATRRTQEKNEESSSWVEVLGVAAESWNKGVEQANDRRKSSLDCTARDRGNRIDIECE